MSYIMHFNKNHDKLGRFTFGDGDGDGVVGKADPNSYRTPELDKKYAALEKTGVTRMAANADNGTTKWLFDDSDDPDKEWGKDVSTAIKLGVRAAIENDELWLEDYNTDKVNNYMLSEFLLGDTYAQSAYPEIAYLASKGYTKDQIIKAFKDADDMWDKNSEFHDAYSGYPKDGYEKYSTEAWEKEPYKNIYTMANMASSVAYETSSVNSYVDKCVELAKEMEHSDMSTSLTHFNPNHDPKTGQFTYALGGGLSSKGTYNGQSKKEFVKSMTEQYKSGGYGSMKSKALARSAVKAYDQNRKQYNAQFRKNQRAASKLESAKAIGDQKKIDKYNKQLKESFRDATVAKEMFKESYALGKDWYNRTVAQYLGGIPAQIAVANKKDGYMDIYNRTKSNVERWMNASPEFHELMYNTELESVTDIR